MATEKIFYKYLKQVSWNGTSISQDEIRDYWNKFSEDIISQINSPTFVSNDLNYPIANVSPKILAKVGSGPTITFTFESSYGAENKVNVSDKFYGDGSMRFEKSTLDINLQPKKLNPILEELVNLVNSSTPIRRGTINPRDETPRLIIFKEAEAEKLLEFILKNKEELKKIDNQSFKDALEKIDRTKIVVPTPPGGVRTIPASRLEVFYRWFNGYYELAKDSPRLAFEAYQISSDDTRRIGEIVPLIKSTIDNPSGNPIVGQLDLQSPQSLAFNRDLQESTSKDKSTAYKEIFKKLRESLLSDITTKLKQNNIEVKIVEFKDVEPQLVGPPTQNVSGVEFKPPTVDNPNIKLPSQEVKSLTLQSTDEIETLQNSNNTENIPTYEGGSAIEPTVYDAQTYTDPYTSSEDLTVEENVPNYEGGSTMEPTVQPNQSIPTVTSETSTTSQNIPNNQVGRTVEPSIPTSIQNKTFRPPAVPSGAISLPRNNTSTNVNRNIQLTPTGAKPLNPKGIVPDGLGKKWSPDKFSPEAIAGNTKYVNPKTGAIGSTSNLARGLTGAAIGGGLGAGVAAATGGNTATIVGAGVGGAVVGGAVGIATTRLNKIKSTMPKPNVPKPPNTPRIKTVKIPRPNDTKGAQALLNLPKSPTL